MTLNEWFKSMMAVTPAEPRGWFRWLHNHYMGRYGDHHPNLVLGDAFPDEWNKPPRQENEPVEKLDLVLALDFINLHPWACGMKKHTKMAGGLWERMSPEARGAFLAGLSERHFDKDSELIDRTLIRLPSTVLTPESLCQLACNAIRFKRLDLLNALLEKYPSPFDEIRRFSATNSKDSWESEELEKVSHRVIDMILEAALIINDTEAATIALEHGANPSIPIWQLERSSNQKYSALGYVLDTEYMQNMQPHKEMTEILLNYGACASGIPFSGYNHELFLALGKGRHDLVERLVAHGAQLKKPVEPQETPPNIRTAGSECIVMGPGGTNFFGHFGDELRWAYENIGSIIPLVPVSGKLSFFSSNAQGGSKSTLMERVVGNVERLKRYEELGLDTRLTAEELCSAVSCGAFDGLVYLLSKYGDTVRDRVMFRIRRHKPDFGTSWRHMVDMVPQTDGVNCANDFDPQGQKPFELPDGSKLYVDLSAIASPGHNLGPCPEGYFWLRKDTVILRRRKDKILVRRLEKRWLIEPFPPRKPGICREQRYLDECLPLIRGIDGKYIHLGVTMGRLWWIMRAGELKECVHTWNDLPEYSHLQDHAEQLIKAQDSWNTRPDKTSLTDDELWGYPPHFWSYLVRLDNGFVGMTVESCQGNVALLKEYKAWARKAKIREIRFVPEPRLLEWEHWSEVPAEYKPYYYWDTMFGDRPSVTGGAYDNKYESAMASKVRNWYDGKRKEWFKAKKINNGDPQV